MKIAVNRERLAATFVELCEIDSPSRREGTIARHLAHIFTKLGADSILEDDSRGGTGSECGNLIIRFPGKGIPAQDPGFFLSTHMDTVQPGEGIKVVRRDDVFTSEGETILGSDDKSGIAAIIELLTLLKEQQLDHPPLEIILTTCEEQGLVGATHLDLELVRSPFGYALDASGIDTVTVRAPGACKFAITVTGRAAHAGMAPEKGVNALMLAAKALSRLESGRLDKETTQNFGRIQGGFSFNIVPEEVRIFGEVRSHSAERLQEQLELIQQTFAEVVAQWQPTPETEDFRPAATFKSLGQYPPLAIPEESPLLAKVRAAGELLGRPIEEVIGGGGSDANIFNRNGLPCAVISTGMTYVHTVRESQHLDDLHKLTELLLALTASA